MTELKPGRELDALVAEKVMGWTRHETNPYPPHPIVDQFFRDIKTSLDPEGRLPKFDGPWFVPPEMETTCGVPAYSTEIEAAWEVVEKTDLLRDPWVLVKEAEGWAIAALDEHDPGMAEVRAEGAESAPHAICLAALKAVGK